MPRASAASSVPLPPSLCYNTAITSQEVEVPNDAQVPVARVGEVAPGQTKKFTLMVDGRETECFLVNHGGRCFAYVNRCRHVPMTMDWVENQFLTEDGRYILCATHGAAYEPDTGECVFGPPCGKFLDRVPLTVAGGEIFADRPLEEED